MTLLLIYLFGSMLICALCSILETVLMSTPLSFVTMKEEQGYAPAKRFKKYKQNPSRPIAAILLINTIAATVGAIGVGHQVGVELGSKWLGVVSTITTALMLIFSEIIPKTFSAANWKHMMGFTTFFLNIIIIGLFPIVVAVEWIGKICTPKNSEATISREEVSAMANEALMESQLDEDENTLIQNIIKIDNMKAHEAMAPRVVCATAPESMTIKEFYNFDSGDEKNVNPYLHHSRIPVYADKYDYITGYILLTDALKLMADGKGDQTLGSIRRDIELFDKETPMGQVWDVMLLKKEHICCLMDEYGVFQGILTLEDIIETLLDNEIVNEIDMVSDMQEYARDLWEKRRKVESAKQEARKQQSKKS